jgi:hypothetical protein
MTAAARRPALHIGQILDRRRVLLRNVLISYVYLCDRTIEMRLAVARTKTL